MKNSKLNLNKIFSNTLISAILITNISNATEVLKFAHVFETSHPLHEAAIMAAKRFEKETNGRYKIEVYPSSQLGGSLANNENLNKGEVDIIHQSGAFSGYIYGPISMVDFPYVWRNIKHWEAFRQSDLFKELSNGYTKATGHEIVAYGYYGTRQLSSNKALTKPEDLVDLKYRVPIAPAYFFFPDVIGSTTTPLAFAKVYDALKNGEIDAVDNPLTTIRSNKFYEVQSHIMLTGHIINSFFSVISESTLKKLSASDKKILANILKDTAAWSTKKIMQDEVELIKWFKAQGVKVVEVDVEPFRKKIVPELTVRKGLPFSKELYERLQAIPDAR